MEQNNIPELSIADLQKNVDTWITTTGVKYFAPLTNLGILMEEVGELSRLMVRKYGEQSTKQSESPSSLADEMADILWVLSALANQCDVDLTSALAANFEKKNKRDATRHLENKKLQ
jgi:NTP pyrophosphatase (non-canonical NTP hydrolase)